MASEAGVALFLLSRIFAPRVELDDEETLQNRKPL
jgi:hypothetical protein